MIHPLMKCGHAANSISDGKPSCVICVGIHPGASIVEDNPPDLAGRIAVCDSCQKEKPSSLELAFFEYGRFLKGKRNFEKDSFYCGCRGWD